MIDLRRIKTLFIDGHEVKSLSINNQIVWRKSSGWKGLKFENSGNAETKISMYKNGSSAPEITLMYSLDDGQTWNDFVVCSSMSSLDGTVITLTSGLSVCFKAGEGGNNVLASSNGYNIFYVTGSYNNVSLNINSLLDGDGFEQIDDLTGRNHCFSGLFYGSSLTTAPELPATTLADSCYANMFYGSSLTTAPELPATTLADSCYANMFYGSSLTTAPELPATTLADSCYANMFQGCESLKTAPEIPATIVANKCCYYMFFNCPSLTKAPSVLPATTLAYQCYHSMFKGCTSLTSSPKLPATNLAELCYANMFSSCKSLTQAPELHATKLAVSCYNNMFNGCTSLTQAPELPATTLANNCYYWMFRGCTSLTQAPELPATTLANNSYYWMFRNCTSLKRIKMNASSGNWGSSMFNGCTSLELVDMTGSIGVPTLSNVNNFSNTNNTYKIVVPDSLYDTWITATNWASIASHIMKKSDWNSAHPDDILG